MNPLKSLLSTSALALASLLPLPGLAEAQTSRTIIGVDISGSSTFGAEQHSANEAARYVQGYISELETPHDLMLISLGDPGLAQRAIDVRVTVTNRRATSPDRMAAEFGAYLSALLNLIAEGRIEEDGSTSIVSFFHALSPVCASGDTNILLFTDGVEWSSDVNGRAFLNGSVSLPAPDSALLSGCSVEMHGIGQLRADQDASDLERRLIPIWRDWLREAGADSVRVTGGVWAMLANPSLLGQAVTLEAGSENGRLRVLAQNVADMMRTEYFPQHREAALRAMRIFALGSQLHEAGSNAKTNHAELIRRRAVIFVVGTQAYMRHMGPYFALHLMGFLDALYHGAGPLAILNDEFTNTPLKPFVEALTTIRGFGGEAYNIAQSRSEIVRKFGERECATIEDNAIVKQWFGFSNFEEAKRVSEAMGQVLAVESGLNVDLNETYQLSTNRSLSRQTQMSPAELMAMPLDQQLIHIKDIGFLRARKLRQNQIAPYCRELAPNPLEGGQMRPDPTLTLKTPKRNRS